MENPLSLAAADTPASVLTVALALALFVFPILFTCVCILMRFSGVHRPPYFAYFCAFGSLGSLSLGIATSNSPLSALGFCIAFLISPFLLVRNFFALRSRGDRSIYHQGACWASLFAATIIVFLLVWSLFDEYLKSPKPSGALIRAALEGVAEAGVFEETGGDVAGFAGGVVAGEEPAAPEEFVALVVAGGAESLERTPALSLPGGKIAEQG